MPPRSPSFLKSAALSPTPFPAARCASSVRCANQCRSFRPIDVYGVYGYGVSGRRGFVASRLLGSSTASKNHYERLNIRHDASPSEIKKSFYRLSKVHHPDANPNDPSASQNFSLLSESYTILSDPPRRAAYDRDVLRLHHSSSHAATAAKGSYYSPAGGRPASGLSRRRGTFRGPPPSFYRSGGWGDQSEKRRKAHEESTGTGSSGGSKTSDASGHHHHHHGSERMNPWSAHHHHQHPPGGMGPGSDPFGHHEDVPHFDKRATEKTQRREDQRRWERGKRAFGDDDIEFEPQMSLGAHFMVIIGILATSFVVPIMYLRIVRTNRKKKEDGP